jgi:hypothetical protein
VDVGKLTVVCKGEHIFEGFWHAIITFTNLTVKVVPDIKKHP